MHPGVNAFDLMDRGHRARRVGEDDGQHQVERPLETRERLGPEATVRRNGGGDERVRHLEEERAAPAEEHDRLAVDAPEDARAGEQAAPRVDDRALAGRTHAVQVLGRELGSSAGGRHAAMVAVGAPGGERRGH